MLCEGCTLGHGRGALQCGSVGGEALPRASSAEASTLEAFPYAQKGPQGVVTFLSVIAQCTEQCHQDPRDTSTTSQRKNKGACAPKSPHGLVPVQRDTVSIPGREQLPTGTTTCELRYLKDPNVLSATHNLHELVFLQPCLGR